MYYLGQAVKETLAKRASAVYVQEKPAFVI